MSSKKSKIKSFNLSTQIEDGKIVKASVLKINESDLGKKVKVKIYSDVVSDGKDKIVAEEIELQIGEAGQPIPPIEPQQCKEGEHWDAALGKCVPDTVIPPTEPPQQPQPTGDLILAGAGDNEDGPEADTILSKIAAEKPTRYLFLGDSSYNDNDADKWISLIEKNGLSEIAIIIQGNHEHAESDAQACETDIENWKPYLKETPEVNPNEPSWEKTKWLSGQQVKNAYIIGMNSQDQDRVFMKNQYNYVIKQLDIAKSLKDENKIDWIIVLIHKPWYTLKSGSHAPEKDVRNIYQPLFEKHQVDFVLSGHVHNVQNWLPLTTNAQQLFTKLPDGTFDFTKPHGQFFLIWGAGGHEHNGFTEDPAANPNILYTNDKVFSYGALYIKGKNATVQTKDSTGKVINEFKVTKGEGEGGETPTHPIEPPVEPEHPIEPPTGGTELDDNGVQMLHKTTGKFVDDQVGGDPAGNGQRYSVNHKFENYMLIGYWKTGPNQELIEHKTDGPNHGSCKTLPRCCWTEPAIELATGKAHISSEWPHPQNHPAVNAPSAVTLNKDLRNKWIGYAVVAYQDGEFRTIEQWCDPTGLNAQGKPNNNWQLVLKETDKGQITNPELAKRKMATDGRGLESEIRMHKDDGKHGTTVDMKFARVYEIVNPTTS